MTPIQYFVKYPLQSILGVSIVLSILFFPILFLVFAVFGWIYEVFIKPENQFSLKAKKPVYSDLEGQCMSISAKKAYLQSEKWKALTKQVHERDKVCQVTGRKDNLEVHHVTYARLGDELLSDLVLLNRDAHQKIHDKLGYDRDTLYPISAYWN